jgi:hypothetical protein
VSRSGNDDNNLAEEELLSPKLSPAVFYGQKMSERNKGRIGGRDRGFSSDLKWVEGGGG